MTYEEAIKRKFKEEECKDQSEWKRDKSRIGYYFGFRKGQSTTEVIPDILCDQVVRERGQHSFEISLSAYRAADYLQLFPELADAFALGHDLGHPPFGHAGEDSLNRYAQKNGLYFNNSIQSLRCVTELSRIRKKFRGLNLTQGLLLCFSKQADVGKLKTILTKEQRIFLETDIAGATIEGQLVKFLDVMIYIIHDIEDAYYTDNLSLEVVKRLPIISDLWPKIRSETGNHLKNTELLMNNVKRVLYYHLFKSLYKHTEQQLKEIKFKKGKLYLIDTVIVGFENGVKTEFDALKNEIKKRVYLGQPTQERDELAKKIISKLIEILLNKPELIQEANIAKIDISDQFLVQQILDIVWSMKERYVINFVRKYDPDFLFKEILDISYRTKYHPDYLKKINASWDHENQKIYNINFSITG